MNRVKVASTGLLLILAVAIVFSLYWIESQKFSRAVPRPSTSSAPWRPTNHSGSPESVTKPPKSVESPASTPKSVEPPASTHKSVEPPANTPKSWKPGSFCDKFIDHTLSTRQPMCNGGKTPLGSAVRECYVSPYSKLMATCFIDNMAFQPVKFSQQPKSDGQNKIPMYLLKSNDSDGACGPPVSPTLMNKIENGDWIKTTLPVLVSNEPMSPTSCKMWVNETAYFFEGPTVHIYFRFLAWYNLHKAIVSDSSHSSTPPMIVRLSHPIETPYLFPEYEKVLFPNLYHLNDFPDDMVCFKRSVFVPREFASVLFRCKMEADVRSQCFQCNGRDLTGTSLYTFRQRVLQACSLTDKPKVKDKRNVSDPVRIVVILRKPYERWKGAPPNNVERRLQNEQELLTGLKSAFPVTNLSAVHMEDLPICEQIGLVHEADALVGVHGAGLVHLWWLQESGVLLELIPSYELSNPTFKMLATLAGRRYQSISIGSGKFEVRADVPQVVKALQAAVL